MQFEDFDSKLRQAADQHHPNYDEKAWTKMQTLLDQHLPANKDRDRRIFFLLLLVLLVGGGIWMVVSKPWQHGNPTIGASKNAIKANKVTSPASASNSNDASDQSTVSAGPVEREKAGESAPAQTEKIVSANPTNTIGGNETQAATVAPITSKDEKGQSVNVIQADKSKTTSSKQNKSVAGKNKRKSQSAVAIVVPAKAQKGNGTISDKSNIATVQTNNTPGKTNDNGNIAMTNSAQTQAVEHAVNNETKSAGETEKKDDAEELVRTEAKKIVAKKSPGSKKSNYLFFSFSVGPDMSYISLSDPGEVKLLSGAGVGYSIKDRWIIRTGFYAGSKIYTANKDNYKPTNPGNTYYLEKIDANCMVYEVPLSVAYNFSKAEKHSFFGSMGLSSFFMKKEEYQYLYKYPGPPVTTYTHTKELYNENKHYFSVLTLSAGYGLKLNKTFSVSAEPYIKLPLAGIGYGHVKLNSMGVLFSVNVAPFRH